MKTFYDIHMHALNLSHVNLTAHLFRDDMQQLIASLIKGNGFDLLKAGAAASLAPGPVSKKIYEKLFSGDKPFMKILGNSLAFLEIPMEYQFLVLEYYLTPNAKKQIKVADVAYDKMLLCPLVIDFGYKNIQENVFYKLTPKRPIASQVGDLLYAIRTYYRFHLKVARDKSGKEKMSLSREIQNAQNLKHEKFFEIYPFMGLDTRNYSLPDLKRLLKKYFHNFKKSEPGAERRARLFEKMGRLDSNMAGIGRDGEPIDYADVFAGIKLYPQLGFDPWPGDNPEELQKVRHLYQYCVDKRIPVTTHCSDGGYKVGDHDSLTRPGPDQKWWEVLKEFPDLTLNFAHFGAESKSKKRHWRNAIIWSMEKHANVYADISCNDADADYYKELENLFNPNPKDKIKHLPNFPHPKLSERLLFGSDFSINLLASKVDSYNAYLNAFQNSGLPHIHNVCEHNPQRFLFGE